MSSFFFFFFFFWGGGGASGDLRIGRKNNRNGEKNKRFKARHKSIIVRCV